MKSTHSEPEHDAYMKWCGEMSVAWSYPLVSLPCPIPTHSPLGTSMDMISYDMQCEPPTSITKTCSLVVSMSVALQYSTYACSVAVSMNRYGGSSLSGAASKDAPVRTITMPSPPCLVMRKRTERSSPTCMCSQW